MHAGLVWDPENYLSAPVTKNNFQLLAKSEPDDAGNAEMLAKFYEANSEPKRLELENSKLNYYSKTKEQYEMVVDTPDFEGLIADTKGYSDADFLISHIN